MTLFPRKLELNLSKQLEKNYSFRIALYCPVTWAFAHADRKYFARFDMWCCRRTEKISGTDCVRNEEVLQRVKEDRNILQTIQERRLYGFFTYYAETAF
jgi:hypothetical protein